MEKEQNLLSQIQLLIDKEKGDRTSKGEDFNIFLITKKTSNEQYTHSAFIAELLNPKGSHNTGDIFLKEFVKIISKKIPAENKPERVGTIFNEYNSDQKLSKTEVCKEYSIGNIDLDKSNSGNAMGGKIDILLNLNGYYISIENKIYANLQPKQIERYKNYNKDTNIVFYLTLDGESAKEKGVTNEEDYYCISYYNEIDEWLNKCYYLSPESQLILRESIRQYQLLIQKLSRKMKYTKELQKLILKDIEAADMLNKNFDKALNIIKDDFRNSIIESLNKTLKDKYKNVFYEVIKFNPIKNKNARIYIKQKNKNYKLYFGIESFSGYNDGILYGGIYVIDGKKTIAEKIKTKEEDIKLLDNWWPIKTKIYKNSLKDVSTLIKLRTNEKKFKENSINEITTKMIELIDKYKDLVFEINDI